MPSPRPLPDLIEDAITEILLCIPPDEPAHLFAAALVCKPWLRIVTDPSFLSRYRKLHRAPPFLGYLCIRDQMTVSMPAILPTTTAASPLTRPAHDGKTCAVSDRRHGRVLICSSMSELIIVWDPITGDQKKLSVPDNYPPTYYARAVLCAVDGCDHLNCHAGAFRVVCCGPDGRKIWVIMYSSETREWSSMISIDMDRFYVRLGCSTLIGNTLYFRLECCLSLLKYDLGRHELSVISSPSVRNAAAMELDDGGLGVVAVLDNCIYKWSWQADPNNNGTGSWSQHMVMEIDTVLPRGDDPHEFPRYIIGLVESTDTILINRKAGLFTLDLKSRKVKKIGKSVGSGWIKPYMSFYTPDFGRFPALVSGEAS